MFEVRSFAALGTLVVVGVAMAGVAGAAGPAADAHPQAAPENDTQPPGDTPTPPDDTPTLPEETPTPPGGAATPPEPTGLEESARAAESLGLDVHMEMDEDGIVFGVEEEVNGTVVLKIDGPSEDYAGTGTYEVDGQREVELPRPSNAGDLTTTLSGDGFTFSRTMIFEYRDVGCGESSSSAGLPDLAQLAASRSLLVVGFESRYVVERNGKTRRGNSSFAIPAPEVQNCDNFIGNGSLSNVPDEKIEAKAWNETVEERNGSIVSEDAVSMAKLQEQEGVPDDLTPPADLTPPEDFEDGPPEDITPPGNLTPPEDITPPDDITPPEGEFGETPPEGAFETPPEDVTPPEDGFETPPEGEFEQTPPEGEFEQTPPEDGFETPPEDEFEQTPPEDGFETPPEDEFEQTPPEDGFETPPEDEFEQTPPEDEFEQTPPEDEFEGNVTEPADS